MKRHLTEDEIVAFLLGERPAEIARHVQECGECAQQTSVLSGAIAGFREAATLWAGEQQPAARVPEPMRWWQPRPQWALAAVTLALIAVIPTYRHFTAPAILVTAIEAQNRLAVDLEADTALLQQVNAEISRSVPAPMEPLLTLVQEN